MVWRPKATQNARFFRLFMESMDVINEALCFPPEPQVVHIGRVARTVSIELRKLLFDGSPLLHRVLQGPRLHPLKAKDTLTGDIYENSVQLSIAPANSEKVPMGPPATREWSITVHPLHGLKFHEAGKRWILRPMFDTDAGPMALGQWLRQRLFCVENREYSLLDTLKFLVNREAVHVDTEDSIIFKDMESVHFSNTAYYHMVAILAAAYLLSEYRTSQQVNNREWQSFSGFKSYEASEPASFLGAEFRDAEIDPMGLPDMFHETGIPIPNPGKIWKPIQVKESVVVCP